MKEFVLVLGVVFILVYVISGLIVRVIFKNLQNQILSLNSRLSDVEKELGLEV